MTADTRRAMLVAALGFLRCGEAPPEAATHFQKCFPSASASYPGFTEG
jgi:hypothetical protein